LQLNLFVHLEYYEQEISAIVDEIHAKNGGPEFAHLYCLREPEPSMLLS
jgi:hypothetical protein